MQKKQKEITKVVLYRNGALPTQFIPGQSLPFINVR